MKKVVSILFVLLVVLGISVFSQVEITMWFHSGRGEEREVIEDQVKRFNAVQNEVKVVAVQLPEGSYNDQVNAAALARDLPDILDLDGPFVSNYAWAGYLRPLDEFMSSELKQDFLPSIIAQGTYNGSIYALGTFDSGLALWGNKALLEKANVRIPKNVEDAWTFIEFMDILRRLKELPEVTYPLDLKANDRGEWYTYGLSPFFQGFGADLIDRETYMSAEGVLNGPEAVAAASWLQALFEQGFVNSNPPGYNVEFLNGEIPLEWAGHWEYPQGKAALGDDLVLIPAPKFFKHVSGMGSWAWAITTNSKNPEAAWKFLEFLLKPEEIVKMSNANGAVPSRYSAIELSELYKEGGPLNIYAQQLNTIAVPRPVTPAYPAITLAFQDMIGDLIRGADVQEILDRAVRVIDQDIESNQGYPIY